MARGRFPRREFVSTSRVGGVALRPPDRELALLIGQLADGTAWPALGAELYRVVRTLGTRTGDPGALAIGEADAPAELDAD
jgi:hypothetical protein